VEMDFGGLWMGSYQIKVGLSRFCSFQDTLQFPFVVITKIRKVLNMTDFERTLKILASKSKYCGFKISHI
jgi:hypothetical protein